MKHIGIMALLLLLAAGVGEAAAQTQADSTNVSNDSITWNKELEGIEIKAQRQLIKQEIDRIGYDVQADEESKTLTVMDMLRKVPMVTVDGEDNIKVKGNSGFKIYKNGRYDPSLTKNAKEVLKAMPASMVKRIEVITDPGAREDAEGVNAILNIVMVDGRRIDGVTGSVTGAYTTLNHPNLGAYLTTQMGKVIVSVDYGYGGMSSKETENKSEVERTYVSSGNIMKGMNESSNPGYIHYADIDASYDIDSLNLLSASLGGYFYNLDVNGGGLTQMYAPDKSLLYSYRDKYWMPGYSHHSWNGRLDYQHKTRRRGELFTLSYMLALTCQRTEQENSYTDLQNAPFDYTGKLQNLRELSDLWQHRELTRWQLEGYVQWKPFKGTTLSANFNLWDDKIENPSIGLSQKGYSGFYYLNGSQKLPWKLRLTAYTYGEMGHSVNNVYSHSRPWNRFGFSLQRSFLSEDRLTVRISANDLFRKYRHYTDCTTQGDILGYSDSANRASMINFSISYRFGKLKASVKKTETTIDNSDVVGGITKGK